MRLTPILLAPLVLAACERGGDVNPPTEPARPIEGPGAVALPPERPPGSEQLLPGAGPVSFVGRWAAEAEWCANPRGDRAPITITATHWEGYENRCDITRIDQVSGAYVAHLSCEAEGTRSNERVRLAATDQTLDVTWLDRSDRAVRLLRCTTLAN